MLAVYMDHHVPAAITDGVRSRGIDVLTAFEDGHADADDALLLVRATRLGRIVFTRDRDFLASLTPDVGLLFSPAIRF